MSDMAMCKGESCPLKEKCLRYKAKPDKWQVYFTVAPYLESEKQDTCEYYIERENGKRK